MSHAKLAPDAPPQCARTPSVSILLLMKNERHNIEPLFEKLDAMDFPGAIEYIYVDSGSTDGTVEMMKARGIQPHIIPSIEFHHGRTRNLAASLARNEILVMLSGDAIPADDQWLKNLIAPFEDPDVGGVYGRQIPPPGTGPLRARGLEYIYPTERQVRVLPPGARGSLALIRCSNANSAFRGSLWRRFRFHENAIVAEDHWMCYKILKHGLKVVYEPSAAVIHGHERSIWGEFQFAVDNAVSLQRMGIFDDPAFGGEFRYGMDRIRSDWRYFMGRREPCLAVHSFLISAAKWLGVQLGKRERWLPRPVLHTISGSYAKLYK